MVEVFIGHVVLSNTTSSLYSLCLSLLDHGHDKINNLFIELDIVAKIQVIDEFIREIPTKNNRTIEVALNNLNKINVRIHQILKQIEVKIEEHKNKYLYGWRTPDYQNELSSLKTYNKILDSRFDLLVRLINLKMNYL